MQYDARMDPECIAVCDALNSLRGIETFESCCGHGKDSFLVFFTVEGDASILMPIERAIQNSGWKLDTYRSYRRGFVIFVLTGPADPEAGNALAARLRAETVSESAATPEVGAHTDVPLTN
jgi:hypothetical protein